jgi:hypothetical protein
MAEKTKDLIVSIDMNQTAQLESWLLGHGFQAHHSSQSEDGKRAFYAVKGMSEARRVDLAQTGAQIVSEWALGERQSD